MSNSEEDAFLTAKSVFSSCGRSSMKIQEFLAEYRSLEGEDVPFQSIGFSSIKQFLQAAGITVENNMVSYQSQKASHIVELIRDQKQQPKKAVITNRNFPITANRVPAPKTTVNATPQKVETQPLPLNELCAMMDQTNRKLDGQTVEFDEYIRCLKGHHGSRPLDSLKARRFRTNAEYLDFIAQHSSYECPVVVIPPSSLKIGNTHTNREIDLRFEFKDHAPFSNAFSVRKNTTSEFVCDIVFGEFDSQTSGLVFAFSFVNKTESLERLIEKISSEYPKLSQISPEIIYQGMPCLARLEEKKVITRAVVTKTPNIDYEALLYYVDYGIYDYRRSVELREIPKEFLEEPVFSYNGTVANVAPAQGSKFPLKVVQEIKDDLDGEIAKAQINGYDEKTKLYSLDLTNIMETYVKKGWLKFIKSEVPSKTTTTNGVGLNGYGRSAVQAKVLRNCSTFYTVTEGGEVGVPSGCISALLGLTEDTFLETLLKSHITLTWKWEANNETKNMLVKSECPLLQETVILIPADSVVPLIMAFHICCGIRETTESKKLYKEVQKLLISEQENRNH